LTKLILIISGITVATGIGYVCRKFKVVDERTAGPLMFKIVVFGWTPLSALVLWQLDLQISLITLPIVSAILPLSMAPIGFALARVHKLDRKTAGTFIVGCGIANIGVTLGGFVCYCLFGMEGLGYAQLYVMVWAVTYVGFYYPVAKYYGEGSSAINLGFVLRTFFDRRALPVVGSIVGLTLNLCGVAMQRFITAYHVIDAFLVVSVLVSFFCMGLQIHFASITEKPILHVSLAAAKFFCAPAIMLCLLAGTSRLPGQLPTTAYRVAMIESFMPTAIFTVVISNLFNLNARLASMLFVVNTAAFLVIVLPILVLVFA